MIEDRVRRRFALFALLVIAAMQVALSAHQFQHVDPSALGDTCVVCLKAERFDETVAQAQIAETLPSVLSAFLTEPVAGLAFRPLRHYATRAPPIV